METNADRVLQALRLSTKPLDDDELSKRLGIEPRQKINQVCRKLASRGALRRVEGPDGKIVNVLEPQSDADDPVQRGHRAELPAGDSSRQRQAERVMLDLLGAKLGVELNIGHISGPGGSRVEIDGVDNGRTMLVEAWAHQGPPKPAQKQKVLADALKLTWVASHLPVRPRLMLLMSDDAAARPFISGKSWAAEALRDLGVEVHVVEIDAATRDAVADAQRKQYR